MSLPAEQRIYDRLLKELPGLRAPYMDVLAIHIAKWAAEEVEPPWRVRVATAWLLSSARRHAAHPTACPKYLRAAADRYEEALSEEGT